jgi:hypothetical protein
MSLTCQRTFTESLTAIRRTWRTRRCCSDKNNAGPAIGIWRVVQSESSLGSSASVYSMRQCSQRRCSCCTTRTPSAMMPMCGLPTAIRIHSPCFTERWLTSMVCGLSSPTACKFGGLKFVLILAGATACCAVPGEQRSSTTNNNNNGAGSGAARLMRPLGRLTKPVYDLGHCCPCVCIEQGSSSTHHHQPAAQRRRAIGCWNARLRSRSAYCVLI